MIKEESMNRMKKMMKNPLLLVTILSIFVLLFIFVIFPLYKVFAVSFVSASGKFSIEKYKEVFSNAYMRQGFKNSILVASLTAIIGTFIGYIFAYSVNRANIPLNRFFRTVAVVPMVFPPFIGAMSIIMLFGFNGLITSKIFGITNFPVYGFWGLMIAQVVTFFPVAFITLDGVLSTISPVLEDAAFNLKANRWQVFFKVVLPLSMPGITSTMLVLFIESLADFGNPLILAGSRFPVLSVQAYLQITGMSDLKAGAALAVWLLIPSLIAFVTQKYWVSKKRYVTVTGKPRSSSLKSVSKFAKWNLFALCFLFAIFIVLIYTIIFWGAFTKAWGMNNQFTLENFSYVFDVGFDSIKDTVMIALTSAPISAVLGMIIAFLIVRKTFWGRKTMEFVSMLNFAVPGTVIGIGYILAFNSKPFLLTGTFAILVLNFIFRYIPVGIQSGVSLLGQVDPSIEEAAYSLGANDNQVFRKITLPLITPAFFSALVYAFVRAMTAISAAIFLVSANWNLMTVQILSETDAGRLSAACAYSVILIVIILVFMGVSKALLKSKISVTGNYSA